MQLFEAYRPVVWSDVVFQDKALATIGRLRARGLGGRAYWISGQSGTGKTTIARLLAAEVADPISIEEIDTTELTTTSTDRIRANHARFSLRICGRTQPSTRS